MKNEDIFSLVDELPLFVTLKLKRDTGEPTASTALPAGTTREETLAGSSAIGENLNESSSSGRTSPNIVNVKVSIRIFFHLYTTTKNLNNLSKLLKIPIGYNVHTIYLSSLESKCIMPNDLRDCSDAEGLYRVYLKKN